jgi:hypothetical protein
VKWSKNEFLHYFSWPFADFGIFFHHEKSVFRKNWKGLFRRKILCSFRIWFLFWQKKFTTAIFPENEPKIFTFLAITFVKMKISNCWFFSGNNSPLMTFRIQKIENAVKRSGSCRHRYRKSWKKCHFPIILWAGGSITLW